MREIGSVADDLDVGAVCEGKFMYFTFLGNAHFGEVGATIECIAPNIFHRLGYCNTCEV